MTGDTQAPDPDDIQYLADLLEGLASLRSLSYKKFEDASKQRSPRAGYPVLAKTTVYNMLTGNRFPTEERLLSYLVVCEVPAEERQRWLAACRRARANSHKATEFSVPEGSRARVEESTFPVPPKEETGSKSTESAGAEQGEGGHQTAGDHAKGTRSDGDPSTDEPPDRNQALTTSGAVAGESRIRVLRPLPTSATVGASAYRSHRGKSRGPASQWLAGKRCMFVGAGATLVIIGLVASCYYAVVPEDRVRSFRIDESAWTYRYPDNAEQSHVGHLDRGVYEFSCWTRGAALNVYDPVDERRYDSDIWVRTSLDSEDQRNVYISDLRVRLFDDRHPDVRALLPECSWSVFG